MAINIFIWVLTATALLYMLVMVMITLGWFRLKSYERGDQQAETTVSIIVAMRNEESNILHLLKHLYQQDYPQELMEIILVDDHSEDQTKNLVGEFRKSTGVRNIILEKSPGIGKKAAIIQGVKLASGELIITTDADCEMPPDWVSGMAGHYDQYHPMLISGPVIYHQEKSIWQKFFSVDFIGLVASGAGSAGLGLPLMANGANMAFNRKAFGEISSSMPGSKYASGDDVFLLHKMCKTFGDKSFHFVKDQAVTVATRPPENAGSFFAQRVRWASKAKAYRTPWSILVPLAVAAFNLMLVSAFAAGFVKAWFFLIFLLYILLKFLIDLPLLFDFMGFVNKSHLRAFVLPFEFIAPFYVVIAAFLSLFFRYSWKGRKGVK